MLRIIPTQSFERRNNFVITGKKYNGCKMSKALVITICNDEFGHRLPEYDSFAVQKYDNYGMPVGRRYFDSVEKARKYYMSNVY